jgi:hypothetical protein
MGIDRDQQEVKLESKARIHLHAAVGGRQMSSGRHLHEMRKGEPRLGVGRQAMEIPVGDGHEFGPAAPMLRRCAVEDFASAIGRLLQWNLQVMGSNRKKPDFEFFRGVKRGAAKHDRHTASDRGLARQRRQ